MVGEGEPSIDPEGERTDIRKRYLRYTANHSYELGVTDGNVRNAGMGLEENYQPNFGFWDLEMNGDVLIHNKFIVYEKRYQIIELTEEIMIRKLIGDRITYLEIEEETNNIDTLLVSSWIEVFVPLPD